MDAVEVKLPAHEYQVTIGAGALGHVAPFLTSLTSGLKSSAQHAFVIADSGVPRSFVDSMVREIDSAGCEVRVATLTPSEQEKSIETTHGLLKQVALSGHTRSDPIIVIGGGVVGDIAGFVAASYQRGVPVIQCPTTLLSMVDASVGGKTGVNLSVESPAGERSLLKNLVGAFHQPRAVFADIDVLESLEERYRISGLAECVKHGMIGAGVGARHAGLMDWMIEHCDSIRAFDPATIQELVVRNVAIKADVVVDDERESIEAKAGGRMLLNFGHTFGHAVETIGHLSPDSNRPDLAPLHHGEAVALGMMAACNAALSAGRCEQIVVDGLKKVLEAFQLPAQVSGLPTTSEVVERMSHDKKVSGKALRVILPTGWGKCEIVNDPDPQWIADGIDSIRA